MANAQIISDPKVMFGKPVIAGTRITVEHILRCLAAGETPDEIVADYPPLTREDIKAAQATVNIADAIRAIVGPLGGIELDIPLRNAKGRTK